MPTASQRACLQNEGTQPHDDHRIEWGEQGREPSKTGQTRQDHPRGDATLATDCYDLSTKDHAMKPCPACGQATSETARVCEHCGSPVIKSATDNVELADRIRRLVAEGQKIEAIKLLREATGVGLAEAKAGVEAIERGDTSAVTGMDHGAVESNDELEQRLLRLVLEGQKIQAVKLYREHTSSGLKEAKEFVESLAVRHDVAAPRGGCLGVLLGLMIVFVFAATCAARAFGEDAALKATISRGEKSVEGWITHTVESEFQAKPTEIRVLLPDKFDPVQRNAPLVPAVREEEPGVRDASTPAASSRVLFVLPVEAAREAKYGDGLAEVKRLDLHNKHGLICVAPTFAHLPWYADHPTDKTIRQESYFVQVVVPFIDRTYTQRRMDASSVRSSTDSDGRGVHPTRADRESRWLLGFSKSGWGAWSLLARHPDLFDKAAAWDAPLDMPRFDLYGAAQVFGTQDHFETHRVLPAILNCPDLKTASPRLILTGYDNFRTHHETTHRLLDEAQVPHVYRDGPKLKHVWNSGWVEGAVELLISLDQRTQPADPK